MDQARLQKIQDERAQLLIRRAEIEAAPPPAKWLLEKKLAATR